MLKGIALFLDESDLRVNAQSAYDIKGSPLPIFEADIIIFKDRVIKNRHGAPGKLVPDDHIAGDETGNLLKETIDILFSEGVKVEKEEL